MREVFLRCLGKVSLEKMKIESEIWIEMLPASEGDCILVTLPDADIRILIEDRKSVV